MDAIAAARGDAAGVLLAAAGKGGRAAIFGIDAVAAPVPGSPDSGTGPLMSFKPHKGWICGIQWIPAPAVSEPTSRTGLAPMAPQLLLTASNDRCVALWDVSKQQRDGSPLCRQTVRYVHGSGGVYARSVFFFRASRIYF